MFALIFFGLYWMKVSYGQKLSEFDFAAYAFGLVAVAVSCAGVYVSVVSEQIVGALVSAIKLHLVPVPFEKLDQIEHACKPDPNNEQVRTAAVKVIYALLQLIQWNALDEDELKKLLGKEGIDAERNGFGRKFRRFQHQSDRKFVLALAISISIIYGIVPFFYHFGSLEVITTILATVYFLCIIEIVTCVLFFFLRTKFLGDFEKHIIAWREELQIFIVSIVRARLPAVPDAGGLPAVVEQGPPPTHGGR